VTYTSEITAFEYRGRTYDHGTHIH